MLATPWLGQSAFASKLYLERRFRWFHFRVNSHVRYAIMILFLAKAKLDGFRSSPHGRKVTDIVLAVMISELIPTKVTFGDR